MVVVAVLGRVSRRYLAQVVIVVLAVGVSDKDLNFCLSLDSLDIFPVRVGASLTDMRSVLCSVDGMAVVECTMRSAFRERCSRGRVIGADINLRCGCNLDNKVCHAHLDVELDHLALLLANSRLDGIRQGRDLRMRQGGIECRPPD